jgi:hypothetical protein
MVISGLHRAEDDQTFSIIVNADDFGYTEGVSRGILDLARKGIVTATGVLANSPFFDEHVRSLLSVPQVDAGVHLNLTAGRPLTAGLVALLVRTGGVFPRKKYGLAVSILSGNIAPALWRKSGTPRSGVAWKRDCASGSSATMSISICFPRCTA